MPFRGGSELKTHGMMLRISDEVERTMPLGFVSEIKIVQPLSPRFLSQQCSLIGAIRYPRR